MLSREAPARPEAQAGRSREALRAQVDRRAVLELRRDAAFSQLVCSSGSVRFRGTLARLLLRVQSERGAGAGDGRDDRDTVDK